MAVTRLKRKDRRNKTASRLKQQKLKMATTKELKNPIPSTEEIAKGE